MDNAFTTVVGLLGGLAIFIFGMNMMSDNLQKVAGEKMKNILALLTKNPVLGVLAGALTTAVLQSSSATTVMAIGFVSARLMGLPQAISIILGANIGTTITAQIIAFKITDYILIFVFVGFLMSFIAKTERIKSVGLSILGFGLLFLGIETMGDSMKPLATSPVFINMISQVVDIPVLGVVVGTVMTVIVQSSSATIAVLQNLAATPGPDGASIIGLTGAIPVLLGDNIGTTITALLASIGQSRNAKRVAVSHSLFNISGCLIFIWFIPAFATFIQFISPAGPEIEVISRQIANAHTSFNVVMTLLWLPFIWLMVKIVTRIIPDRKTAAGDSDPAVALYLDDRLLGQPIVALQLVAKETVRCGETVRAAMHDMGAALRDKDVKRLDVSSRKAAAAGEVCQQVTDYLAELFATGLLNEDQVTRTANLMSAINDIERIGQLCGDVAQIARRSDFSDKASEDLRDAMFLAEEMFAGAMRSMASGDSDEARRVNEGNSRMIEIEMHMRKGHMKRVASKECSPSLTKAFNRVLSDIERIGGSCLNIVEAFPGTTSLDYFLFEDSDVLDSVK
ncbi:Na/Pi cotransporter family protein [Slackia piriformis]|uniref:Na/Pi cotransporter family protein n=1 Tax=Slackia piriformis TaxID=626934 RepID=UPI0026DD0D44|nr:Na/Pi cotransporter family protein [Slackia piriformis]MDO5024074.1 Na/Pi cotransporter family protein [Slackia piriformis]